DYGSDRQSQSEHVSALDIREGRFTNDAADPGTFESLTPFEEGHESVDDLAGIESPGLSIRAPDVDHAHPQVCGVTRGVAADRHKIAGFDGVRDCAAQLAGSGPLDIPNRHLSVLFLDLDMKERVRIAQQDLNHPSFDTLLLARVIGRSS